MKRKLLIIVLAITFAFTTNSAFAGDNPNGGYTCLPNEICQPPICDPIAHPEGCSGTNAVSPGGGEQKKDDQELILLLLKMLGIG